MSAWMSVYEWNKKANILKSFIQSIDWYHMSFIDWPIKFLSSCYLWRGGGCASIFSHRNRQTWGHLGRMVCLYYLLPFAMSQAYFYLGLSVSSTSRYVNMFIQLSSSKGCLLCRLLMSSYYRKHYFCYCRNTAMASEKYDSTLLGILQQEGNIGNFLHTMMGFLYRR